MIKQKGITIDFLPLKYLSQIKPIANPPKYYETS